MGTTICCAEPKGYKSNNLHLYQINRYHPKSQPFPTIEDMINPNTNLYEEPSKTTEINNSDNIDQEIPISEKETNNNFNGLNFKRKKFLQNEKGEFNLLSYDIEDERFYIFKVAFPVIKTIEGLSEVSIKSNFYLCGISSKQKNEGSYLFQVNLNSVSGNEVLKAQILINSQFQHVYPSLIIDKNEQIICVGGKGQTQCELYSSKLNKWYSLPELEEEKYKCTLCIDPKETFVYLFGGINTKNKKQQSENNMQDNDYKVLRMDLIKQLVWENLVVKYESKNFMINRYSCGAFTFKNDEDFIFLIGGEDNEHNLYGDIIRFSIHKLKFESTGAKLNYNTTFFNQNGILNDDQSYYFIDNLNQIHIIDRHDCLPMDYLNIDT